MNKKKQSATILFLFLFLFALNIKCFAGLEEYKFLPPNSISVGTKTSDSAGVVAISNSQIQQNIIANVPILNGMIITSDRPNMIVTPITAYVVFKATNSSGEQMNIAVELEANNSNLNFVSNNGREVHLCKGNGGCTSCTFIISGKRIITCNCNSQNGNNQMGTGCQHDATWLH